MCDGATYAGDSQSISATAMLVGDIAPWLHLTISGRFSPYENLSKLSFLTNLPVDQYFYKTGSKPHVSENQSIILTLAEIFKTLEVEYAATSAQHI